MSIGIESGDGRRPRGADTSPETSPGRERPGPGGGLAAAGRFSPEQLRRVQIQVTVLCPR